MTHDDTAVIRDRLDNLAAAAPPIGFDPQQVVARGRRTRRRRTHLAVAGTAVALALVVAAPRLAPGLDREAAGTTAASTSSAAPPIGSAVAGPIPGLSAADADRVARACARSDLLTRHPGQPTLYNALIDRNEVFAMLYGPGFTFACEVTGHDFRPAGGFARAAVVDWLPGPVSIDHQEIRTRGTVTTETLVGRVSDAVASVVVRVGDRSQRVTPVSGTYAVRLSTHGAGGVVPKPAVTITAYDAGGRVLGEIPGHQGTCYAAPDGTVVIGERTAGTRCVPATRWQ